MFIIIVLSTFCLFLFDEKEKSVLKHSQLYLISDYPRLAWTTNLGQKFSFIKSNKMSNFLHSRQQISHFGQLYLCKKLLNNKLVAKAFQYLKTYIMNSYF